MIVAGACPRTWHSRTDGRLLLELPPQIIDLDARSTHRQL